MELSGLSRLTLIQNDQTKSYVWYSSTRQLVNTPRPNIPENLPTDVPLNVPTTQIPTTPISTTPLLQDSDIVTYQRNGITFLDNCFSS